MDENYLENLVKRIREAGGTDQACYQITANEGEPAIVQIHSGTDIRIFVENEDQTKLELKTEIVIA
jgi:hypothetical protein